MGADDDEDTVRLEISETFLCDSSLQVRETGIASCMVNTFVVEVELESRFEGWRSDILSAVGHSFRCRTSSV